MEYDSGPSPIYYFLFNSSVGLKSQQLQLDWKWMGSLETKKGAPRHSLFRVKSSTTIGKQPELVYRGTCQITTSSVCLGQGFCTPNVGFYSHLLSKNLSALCAWSMDPSNVWPLDCYSSCCQAWSLASGAMYSRVPPMKFANLNGWDFHLQLTFIHDSLRGQSSRWDSQFEVHHKIFGFHCNCYNSQSHGCKQLNVLSERGQSCLKASHSGSVHTSQNFSILVLCHYAPAGLKDSKRVQQVMWLL